MAKRGKLRCCTALAWAATAGDVLAVDAAASPAGSLLKTIFGLLVVLAVMAAIAWAAKRVAPGRGGMQSVVRIVGGVSVGSRERVVVVEVADRWLVVGVAPGRVNAIANLDKGEGIGALPTAAFTGPGSGTAAAQNLVLKGQAFAGWLKQSRNKSAEKSRGQ